MQWFSLGKLVRARHGLGPLARNTTYLGVLRKRLYFSNRLVFNASNLNLMSRIVYSLMGLHTDPEIWGPDANVFDPERWLDERALRHQSPGSLSFVPFSAGPRVCVGQQVSRGRRNLFTIT